MTYYEKCKARLEAVSDKWLWSKAGSDRDLHYEILHAFYVRRACAAKYVKHR